MSLDVDKFFDELVQHLRSRSDVVASLAVMGAVEHWIQFEAAALVDRSRSKLGIDGSSGPTPNWWVACEPRKVDLWIEGPDEAVAIEFKTVHNNKNFYAKVWELRSDLTPSRKPVPGVATPVRRFGIIVVTCVHYIPSSSGRFVVLRTAPRERPMNKSEIEWELRHALGDLDPWYQGLPAIRVLRGPHPVCDLKLAHYVDPTSESDVALWLVAL
jgi:hypothetical protein